MANTEAIKQGTAQAVVEAAKAMILAINGDGGRQNFNPDKDGTSHATRQGTKPSLRQTIFNLTAKDK